MEGTYAINTIIYFTGLMETWSKAPLFGLGLVISQVRIQSQADTFYLLALNLASSIRPVPNSAC